MKFRSPNLYTIIIVAKIKKCVSKEKERIKGFSILFFFFMFIVSLFICYDLKQVESNCGKKQPCERACSWIITFSHCQNFEYRKYGIIFSIRTQNGCTRRTHKENLWSEQLLILLKKVNFIFIFFQEQLAFLVTQEH